MILTLPSNASMNVFPGNKANHFKVELLKELDLSDGEYEVGLMEINFPYDFQREYTFYEGEAVSLRYSETGYEHFRLPVIPFTGPIDLLRKFCLAHAYAWELQDYKFGFARVRLKENSKFFQRIRDMVSIPNGNFYELVGEELKKVVQSVGHFEFERCFISSSEKPEITFFIRCGEAPVQIKFLNVHCNLLRPSEYAGRETRILRSIFVSVDEGEEQRSVFEKPFYHPIDQKRVKVIEITIKDEWGDLIKFKRAPISLTLDIRRRGVESL